MIAGKSASHWSTICDEMYVGSSAYFIKHLVILKCKRIRHKIYIFIIMYTCWMKTVTSTTVANQKMTVWQWTYPLPLSFDFFSLIPFPTPEDWSSFCTSCVVFRFFILRCMWPAPCLKLNYTVTAIKHHMKNSFGLHSPPQTGKTVLLCRSRKPMGGQRARESTIYLNSMNN